MLLKKHKLEVLSILSENLQKSHPQLVPSVSIAEQLNISLSELHLVLKRMDGRGEIETSVDLNYNLITKKGLQLVS